MTELTTYQKAVIYYLRRSRRPLNISGRFALLQPACLALLDLGIVRRTRNGTYRLYDRGNEIYTALPARMPPLVEALWLVLLRKNRIPERLGMCRGYKKKLVK